jgi:Methyltransferase domain
VPVVPLRVVAEEAEQSVPILPEVLAQTMAAADRVPQSQVRTTRTVAVEHKEWSLSMSTVSQDNLVSRPACANDLKLDKALAIKGWMFPNELIWLACVAQEHRNIVELGSYLGRSTRALADNTPGTILCVDDFKGPRDVEIDDEELIYEDFIKNMEGVRHKLHICKQDFADVDPAQYNHPFDMIFIDGGHDYASVKRDIDKWYPYLAPGGLLCGHDFEKNYPELRRAVLERFPEGVKLLPGGAIWIVENR